MGISLFFLAEFFVIPPSPPSWRNSYIMQLSAFAVQRVMVPDSMFTAISGTFPTGDYWLKPECVLLSYSIVSKLLRENFFLVLGNVIEM